MVYLDNSATTKQYREVTETMVEYMDRHFGNPGSLHGLGIKAENAVKEARRQVSKGFGCSPDEIIFTSGGTEGANMLLEGLAHSKKRQGNKIITTSVEHPAVLESCKRLEAKGFKVVFLPVDSHCCLDVDRLFSEIDGETILISVMQVNNEVGTVMPIAEIAARKKALNLKSEKDIFLHTDGVQGFGKLPMPVGEADAISVSGHKIHGPKGIGGVFLRKGVNLPPFIVGGGQERGYRSGTEPVPEIAGFGKAAELAYENFDSRLTHLTEVRSYLLDGIKSEIKDIRVNSIEAAVAPSLGAAYSGAGLCCPSVLNISFLGVRGEVLLHSLEEAEIYVSTGSACSSSKKGQSHVLSAMGLSAKEIEGAIRFSFSEFNTIEEMDYVLIHLKSAVERFRKLGSYR